MTNRRFVIESDSRRLRRPPTAATHPDLVGDIDGAYADNTTQNFWVG
jgi:hypothetical protein